MALAGGGAGNPVGGSSSSVGSGLVYIGDHAYAYSGSIAQAGAGTEKNMLLFHTSFGNYLKGKFSFAYAPLNSGENATMIIYFNDQQVYQVEQEHSEVVGYYPVEMIIPPDTEVKVTLQTTDSSNPGMLVKFVGRVYA